MEEIYVLYKELLNQKLLILDLSEKISLLVKNQNYQSASEIDKQRKISYNRVQEIQLQINGLPNPDLSKIDFITTFQEIDTNTITQLKEQKKILQSIEIKTADIQNQIDLLNYFIN